MTPRSPLRSRQAARPEEARRARTAGEASWPWRGFLVGIPGVVAASFITPYSTLYLGSSQLGVDYLPITAFCLFLFLLVLNGALRLVGVALTRVDLFTAYIMMLVPAAVPVSGLMTRLLPTLVAQFYVATEQNRWAEYFHRFIPSWLSPTDHDAVRLFYEGAPEGVIPWNVWLVPLLTWFVPFAATSAIILSLGVLLRTQWIEHERLTFPLAQVPLALVAEDDRPTVSRSIWRNWVFWAGFGLPFLINLLNGMHYYYPPVPHITGMDPFFHVMARDHISDPVLWELYRDVHVEIHFALIGIAMMMRKEVSFSFWFFQLFFWALAFVFQAVGIGEGAFVNTPNQTFGFNMFSRYTRVGASFVVAGMTFWAMRSKLRRLWKVTWRPSEANDEEDRLLRLPFWGLSVGVILWLAWSVTAGMDLLTAVGMLAVGVIVFVVLARIVCEGGLLWASLSQDPITTWPILVGTTHLSPQTLTIMAYTSYIPLATRANTLPSVMDGLKMSHAVGFRAKFAFAAAAIALPVAFVASAAAVLGLAYGHGANFMPPHLVKWGPAWVLDRAASYFPNRTGPSVPAILTTVAGMGIMGFLFFMHRRFLWWPVYPLGYVVANAAVMVHQWFSILIGWALRMVVTRIWGIRGYRNVFPGALGVIVGSLVSVFLWFIVDALNGTVGRMMTHHTSTW